MECKHTFGSTRKPSRLRSSIWNDFVFNRYTIKQLASKHDRSIDWIRKELRAYKLPASLITPSKTVAVMDCVFFGRKNGYLVVRDPHRKCNIYWSEIQSETLDEYRYARDTLESMGFNIAAVVADGKPGLKPLFEDIPIQMCHFHQKAIITRYLTSRPRLQAGIELRKLVHNLGQMDEQSFAEKLQIWHCNWSEFLSERTVNPETGKWHYTHKRLRSAYKSLKKHQPHLYTYQRHLELAIPNTTNGLEGSFSYLKELVRVHRGMKLDLKRKIIDSILQNRPTKT
jgi:hypothetical protein